MDKKYYSLINKESCNSGEVEEEQNTWGCAVWSNRDYLRTDIYTQIFPGVVCFTGGSVLAAVSQTIREEPVWKRTREIHGKTQRANAVPEEVGTRLAAARY